VLEEVAEVAALAEGAGWRRMAGEPELWYRRFVGFCVLGTERSLEQAWRHHCLQVGGRAQRSLPQAWRAAAARWQWPARAATWDRALAQEAAQEGAPLATSGAALPEGAAVEGLVSAEVAAEGRAAEGVAAAGTLRAHTRRRRLELLDRLIAQTGRALEAAQLETLEPEQLREMLPTLRQLLRDLLSAERAEFPAAPRERQPTASALALAALPGAAPLDEAAVARVQAGLLAFHAAAPAAPAAAAGGGLGAGFGGEGAGPQLVCVAAAALAPDLGMVRALQRAQGAAPLRLLDCRRADLAGALAQARQAGQPVRRLHLACRAGPQGVHFADGEASPAWLRRELAGVTHLLVGPWEESGEKEGAEEAGAEEAAGGGRAWYAGVGTVQRLPATLAPAEADAAALAFWRSAGPPEDTPPLRPLRDVDQDRDLDQDLEVNQNREANEEEEDDGEFAGSRAKTLVAGQDGAHGTRPAAHSGGGVGGGHGAAGAAGRVSDRLLGHDDVGCARGGAADGAGQDD